MTVLVGIRELRQNPAEAIAAVRNGEIVMVTDRGVNVAQLVPPSPTRREQLIAAGKMRPATRDRRSIGLPPVVTGADGTNLSARLAAMRDAERY
jgi:prevent-host-death family protein